MRNNIAVLQIKAITDGTDNLSVQCCLYCEYKRKLVSPMAVYKHLFSIPWTLNRQTIWNHF